MTGPNETEKNPVNNPGDKSGGSNSNDANSDSGEKQSLEKSGSKASAQSAAKPSTAVASNKTSSKSGIRLSPLTMLLTGIFLLLVLGFFVLQQLNTVERKQHQTEIELLKNKNEITRQISQSSRKLQQEQLDLAAQNQELKQALIELRKLAGRERQGWILAEAEYLLLIANHKLKLEGDIKTAMQAMLDADSRLERLSDPQLLPARKLIAQELSNLQTLKQPDINGMSLTLNALSSRIPALGLVSAKPGQLREKERQSEQVPTKTADNKDWENTVKNVWSELKSLVVVRRRDKPIVPMLAPEQEKALRQVLEFKVESARIALLKRQQQQFRNALNLALTWLETHFDAGDVAVIKFKQTLAQLLAINLETDLPDISASLHEVRYQLNKNTGKKIEPKSSETTNKPERESATENKPTESGSSL